MPWRRQSGQVIWGTEPVVCGDGVIGGSETCDTAGESTNCDKDCTARVCGDGVLNPTGGEVCDPGVSSNCLANCSGYPAGQSCINGSVCLKAQVRAGANAPIDNQVQPQFTLINNGTTTIPWSELKLRYWFTCENGGAAVSGLQAWCNWASVGCSFVTEAFTNVSPARTGADTYLEVGFINSGSLGPGQSTGEIQLRFNWNSWVNFDETGDYSYLSTTSYTDTTHVTV